MTDELPRPPPRLPVGAHKGDAGRVLCIAGSRTMPGAALLVARAAQRAGAGLVTMGCLDPELLTLLPLAAPEAVLLDLGGQFEHDPDAWGARAALLTSRSPHAALLGPGLGNDARTSRVLALALQTLALPIALDADALNALGGEPERLRAASGPLVLTPHPLEAERLLGRPVPADADGRRAAALELARRAQAIVCLKGHGTVVADPRGHAWRNHTGNPGLATAGAGDVLAGILVAYLAIVTARPGEGWTPLDAARAAVHVHGLAGDLALERLGERALIASDLVDELARAQRQFEAGGTRRDG